MEAVPGDAVGPNLPALPRLPDPFIFLHDQKRNGDWTAVLSSVRRLGRVYYFTTSRHLVTVINSQINVRSVSSMMYHVTLNQMTCG